MCFVVVIVVALVLSSVKCLGPNEMGRSRIFFFMMMMIIVESAW